MSDARLQKAEAVCKAATQLRFLGQLEKGGDDEQWTGVNAKEPFARDVFLWMQEAGAFYKALADWRKVSGGA